MSPQTLLALLICTLAELLFPTEARLQPAQAVRSDAAPFRPLPSHPTMALPGELELGAILFSDKGLSGDGLRSCATCHDLLTNGADAGRHLKRSSSGGTSFATLSVFNAGLNYRFGWEGRYRSLEDQAAGSLTDPDTMGSTKDATLRAIFGSSDLVGRFNAVYGHGPDWKSLIAALTTFERSLVTPGSRFDQFLSGDEAALTPSEKDGLQLFTSFGCVSCHQGANIGGNLFERSGIFHDVSVGEAPLLRVSSLRNVAVMAPYFHNGSASTLNKAVKIMGQAQLNRSLNQKEVTEIVSFLGTLTGLYDGHPLVQAR